MTVSDINIKIGIINDLAKGLKNVERDLRRASRNFAQVGNEMSVALSLPLLAFGTKAVQTAAQMESLKLAMRTTFQDAGRSISEADKELEALRKSALAPGLDFEQAVKASIRLQNVGLSAEKARATIEQLANAISMSGGTAEDLDGVSIQMAQMISKGKVLAQDLRIIQERMPKITSLMKDAFGVSTADAMQEMGVSGVEFVEKITAEMNKLPRVSGGLANSIVNVGASVKNFLAQIGDDIATTFDLKKKFEDFGDWLAGVAQWFKGLSASTKEWILYIGAAVIAIGPLFKVMGAVMGLGSQMVAGFAKMLQGLSWLTGGALNLTKAFQALSAAQKATVIGLTIAAVAAAVVIYGQLSDGMTQAARTQKMLNDVQLEAAKSIVAERLEAEQLTAIINDENATRDEKLAALKRLRQINAEYFADLDIEKSKVEDVNGALENYIKSIEKRARLTAANQKLVEIEKELLDTDQQFENAKPSYWQQAGNALLHYGNTAGMVMANVQDFTDNLAENKKALEAQKAALLGILKEGGGPVAVAGGGSTQSSTKPGGGGKKGKGEKTVASTLADLSKAYDMAALKGEALGASFDVQGERAHALQSAIVTLLGMGIKPSDEALAPLIERYANLNMELGLLPQKFDGITSSTAPFLETTTQLATMADTVSVAWQALGETMSMALSSAGESMMALAADGEASLKKLGKAALKSAADVVRGALMSFVANVIKDTGIVSGPLAPFVAPAAGAAAGAAFNGILKALKIPAFADGGMVTQPTMAMFGEYPGARSNPEFALRQDQLQGLLNKAAGQGGGHITVSGVLRGTGRDLIGVIETAQQDKFRAGG